MTQTSVQLLNRRCARQESAHALTGAGAGSPITRERLTTRHSAKFSVPKGAEAVQEQPETIELEPVAVRQAITGIGTVILSIPFAAIPNVAEVPSIYIPLGIWHSLASPAYQHAQDPGGSA